MPARCALESPRAICVATARASRRVVRLAFDDAEFAGLLVNLDHADVLFEKAMYPYARDVLASGVESGRFDTPDTEVTLNLIIGGSMSLIRAILAGDFAEGVEIVHAEVVLRALGLPPDEAARISVTAIP